MNNLNNMQNSNMNNNSYDQKKNNGKGIFYGVIAVATLIVAIIGATFAYFSATANSSENALAAVAAHVEVNYTEGRQLKATNLIPSSAAVVTAAYNQPTAYQYNIAQGCTYNGTAGTTEANPESFTDKTNWTCPEGKSAKSTGETETKCVDDNGYYVCAVYQFSVINASNVKQTLQANISVNVNTFTSTDEDGNGALKFMAVRSADTIDTNAISSVSDATTCAPITAGTDVADKLAVGAEYTTVTDATVTTRFCTSAGADDADDDVHSITNDSAGVYLYYNTTAIAQSLAVPTSTGSVETGDLVVTPAVQNVFNGYVLASIDPQYLADDGSIIYLHTAPDAADASLSIGLGDITTTLPGNVYADDYGNTYINDAACTGKAAISACRQVYLSTNSSATTHKDGDGKDDVVLGALEQVNSTFYIVAWLEETNESQDVDQDKSFAATINVTSGAALAGGASGITGTMN